MTTLPIVLQVWKENHLLVRAIQGEGGSRTLTVTFLGADGAPLSLEGCTPRLYLTGTNPPVFTDGTVKDASGGTAEFVLPSGLTETHGVYACQFLLSGTDYPPLKADGLTLLVEASDLESAAEATEEFSALTVALGKADVAGKAAAQAAAEAKSSAETASAAEAVAVGCKTQAVSSAEAAAADRGKADTSAAAAASARDAAQTSAAAAAQNAAALASVYTKAQTDAAFLPRSARGSAGGVMALPAALPAAGSLLAMGADGTAQAAPASNMADWVHDINVTGEWFYRKWADGRTEVFCRHGFGATQFTYDSGTKMYYVQVELAFPSGFFTSAPICLTSLDTNYFCWGSQYVTTANSVKFVVFCPNTTAANVTLNVYAIGN